MFAPDLGRPRDGGPRREGSQNGSLLRGHADIGKSGRVDFCLAPKFHALIDIRITRVVIAHEPTVVGVVLGIVVAFVMTIPIVVVIVLGRCLGNVKGLARQAGLVKIEQVVEFLYEIIDGHAEAHAAIVTASSFRVIAAGLKELSDINGLIVVFFGAVGILVNAHTNFGIGQGLQVVVEIGPVTAGHVGLRAALGPGGSPGIHKAVMLVIVPQTVALMLEELLKKVIITRFLVVAQ